VEAETRALTRCSEGGSERASEGGSQAGARPEVVVIRPTGDAFGWPGVAARVKESPLRLAGGAAWVVRARTQVMGGQFDEVVAHWAVPSAWPIAMSAGPRLTVISHGGDVRLLARLPGLLRAHLVARIADRASIWRFVSPSLFASLVSVLPREDARRVERIAQIAPCAIDVAPPGADAIAEKRRKIGTPFAVCVARLVASKRVEAAIAWAEAEGRALVVVGDGPERARLEQLARANRRTVHFAGRTTRPEALAWIASSSALVQASREEGLSTVVREAEQLGVAVIEI
jgi:teichuronic acid biosynthesis glycosyltransferase TuaC